MDKKSKVFLWVFFLLIVGSVAVTYYRIMIKKDYVIEAEADCDPTTEKCFVYTCDPATETTCTGNPEDDTSYFKKVTRNAANIPLCDPEEDENCKPLEGVEGEKDYTVTYCDEATKAEEEVCNDPEQYNLDNPPAEEEAACEEGDTECEAAAQAATCDPETEDCPQATDDAEAE